MKSFQIISILVIAGTLLGVLLHYLAVGRRKGRRQSPSHSNMSVWEKLVYGTTVVSFLALVGTGFYPAIVHGARLGGFLLMAHTVIGGVFAVALTPLVLTWAESGLLGRGAGRLDEWCKVFFWLLALAALVSMGSMFLSMTSLLGAEDLETLAQVHRWDGLLLIVVMLVHSYLRGLTRCTGRVASRKLEAETL